MAFHRFVTPTYFGGLPGGYTLINVTSGGVGAGGSAFADGAKVGGPNVGTYFVAFGEDATSSNANRGMRALAENTDGLDDLMRRDLAAPLRTNDVTAGPPVSSIVLPTGTFLGVVGYTTSTADLNRLFEITDGSDNEIIQQASGAKVQVTSVTLGGGDAIGGGGANGSFSGNTVQLNISPAIPTGVTYRVYYGTRSNLATMPTDIFSTIRIRGAQEIAAGTEDLFRLLHGNNESWNAAWDSTVYDLTASGLDERYGRKTTTTMASPPEAYFSQGLNSSGSGAWINKLGPAVTVYTGQDAYSDPINGCFAVKFIDTNAATSGGNTGYVAYGTRLSGTAVPGEKTYQPGCATFLSLWTHRHTGALEPANPYTHVPVGSAVNLTSPNTNVNTGESVVELSSVGNYFRQAGTGDSALAVGYDMLELNYTPGGRQVVVVVNVGSSADPTNIRKVRVRNLDGTIPNFTGASAATIVAWHSPLFAVGDGAAAYHKQTYGYSDNVKLDGLYFSVPNRLTMGAGQDNIPRTPARFFGFDLDPASHALEWGYVQNAQPAGPITASWLRASGGWVVNEDDCLLNNGKLSIITDSINALETTDGNVVVDGGDINALTGDIIATLGGLFAAGNIATSAGDIVCSAGMIRSLASSVDPLVPAFRALRHARAAGKERSLVFDFPIPNVDIGDTDAYSFRFYRQSVGVDGMEFVANATWNNTTNLWSRENSGDGTVRFLWQHEVMRLDRVSGAATYTDGVLAAGALLEIDLVNAKFGIKNGRITWTGTTTGSTGANPANTVAITNESRAKNMVKAWGNIHVVAGTISTGDGFNATVNAADVAGDIKVNFQAPMADAEYAVMFGDNTQGSATAIVCQAMSKTTTDFKIRSFRVTDGGTPYSANTQVFNVAFMVMGKQDS